ncbi:2-hydroxyacid dehydrogenase [Falsiroseomonas tokyonensis]|uniref:2-hydroxyacid dehydrogenase n=1 Tax=Falsiroseomonas tokyonensis TaxID=430521 RepID=A0ABV7BQU6_9PROT|nr:glyoxylate/hydroxypyruvate reductase A [Falsiroseomonas tokyonensis]MBU8538016.1 glyoxylate/hydroxypyruvate reductase A [Falsiroseomonas tokyonensis]
MPTILVKSGGEAAMPEWQRYFADYAPGLDVRWWDDASVAPEAVDFVLAWDPEPGRIATLPNLRAIFGAGAGVDLITADPALPKHVPLMRMGPAGATQRMGEFVCWAVLSLLKDARRVALNQAQAKWKFLDPEHTAPQAPVGIMGLGNMGSRAAAMLQGLGFPVRGWSRSRKDLPGVRCFVGAEEFDAFLSETRILVCLLPATSETRGILSAPLFAKLPHGAGLVNVGRGSHQNLDDIMAALDSGRLCGAVLDVFETEPLPAESPIWAHPRAIVTPHMASLPSRRERAEYVAQAIADLAAGRPLANLYDHARGY